MNRTNRQLIRKILIYCSFITGSLIVIMTFMTSKTYAQLAVAIFLFPLPVYFAFKAFPRKTLRYSSKKPVTQIQQPVKLAEKAETAKRENLNIADIDKRAFLKLLGTAGISLFLFSIFNKKVDSLFPKNLPESGKVSLEDTESAKTELSQHQPTDGYKISEIDDNVIAYHGFVNKDGAWFIMKQDTNTGSFRYTKGDSDFPGSWINRENLKYDYFNNVFSNL